MKNESSEPEKRIETDFFDRSSFFLSLLVLILLIVSLYAIIPSARSKYPVLQEGQTAPFSLYSEFAFKYIDEAQTAKKRQLAADKELDYYRIDKTVSAKIQNNLYTFFAEIQNREKAEKKGHRYYTDEDKFIQELVSRIAPATLNCLLRINDNPKQKAKFDRLVYQYLKDGILNSSEYDNLKQNASIKIIDRKSRRRTVPASQLLTPVTAGGKIAVEMLEYYSDPNKSVILQQFGYCLAQILNPGNLQFDKAFTDGKKEEARNMQEKIEVDIAKGTPILKRNEQITAATLSIYQSYKTQLMKQQGNTGIYKTILENVLLCLIVIIAMGMYLFHVQPKIAKSNKSLWLLGLIVILAILLDKFAVEFFHLFSSQIAIPQNCIYFVLPIGFASILISVLFGVRTALFAGVFVSLIAALPMVNKFQMIIMGVIINVGVSLAVRDVEKYRSFFIRAVVGIWSSSFLIGAAFFIKTRPGIDNLIWYCTLPILTGIISAMFALLTLILLEVIFGVNTLLSLADCSDFNHPLLKEMQMRAPGTYHHCLMVSNLAEQAARDAGLNYIKARICGLFHDAGKLVQPEFFIENSPGKDMHKDLDPAMSAIVIRSHADTHGIAMAKKYKLKKILRDTIKQHHGTDLILYFYKKAQEMNPGKSIPEKDFRYPGPLPSEKEICVVMLADCCEAASRSLEHPTPEMIEQLVDEIFRKKIRNGQLNDSELSLKELAVIKKSFINTLEHMNHGRIAYPKDDKKDEDDLFVAAGEKVSPS